MEIGKISSISYILEKQLEEAESTVAEGTLKNVLKMPLNLFNKQLSVTEVRIFVDYQLWICSNAMISNFRPHLQCQLLKLHLPAKSFLRIPYSKLKNISENKR